MRAKFLWMASILVFMSSTQLVSASCWSQCGVVGQREDGSDISWCYDTCDGGSYPTNDGWVQGSAEAGSGGGGGWVDGNGVGHDGATGPMGGSAPTADKPLESLSPINSNDVLNCASSPPCSARQQQEALNNVLNGSGGYRHPLSQYEQGALFTQIKNIDGNGGLDPAIIAAIQNGSIIPAVQSNPPPDTQLHFVLVPAWAIIPPAVIAAGGGGGVSAPSTASFSDCRRCENGNPKSESVLTGTCDSKSLTYCADYMLPEVTPIVEYRFPICHAYAIANANTRTLKIATRAHPIPSTYQFSLADETNSNEKCTIEMVGPDGRPNPSIPTDTDMQVIRCDVVKKITDQSITISLSSHTPDGYGSPVWADRSSTNLKTCNLRLDGNSNPTNNIFISSYGQQLLAIALPFTSPWIKVADGTYARSGNGSAPLINYLPGFVEPFNSSDKDTSSSLPHFLTSTGAGISLGTVNVGSVATISTTNWKVDGYTSTLPNTPTSLFKEIMQKKTYQEYTASNPPPSNLTLSDEITIIDTPTSYTLSSLSFTGNKSSYTLIVKNGSSLGSLNIDTSSLNPTGSPALLLIADQITLSNPAATTIGAIIIANTLKTGTGDALYIKGNLSLTTPLTHQRVRADSDDRKPTIFIEFSPDMYLSLLPSLGSTSREWSQIE